jgi:hypothetical protein
VLILYSYGGTGTFQILKSLHIYIGQNRSQDAANGLAMTGHLILMPHENWFLLSGTDRTRQMADKLAMAGYLILMPP